MTQSKDTNINTSTNEQKSSGVKSLILDLVVALAGIFVISVFIGLIFGAVVMSLVNLVFAYQLTEYVFGVAELTFVKAWGVTTLLMMWILLVKSCKWN